MWQQFTEESRKTIFFAQEEAGRLGVNDVSTEHILLGLLRENGNVASLIFDLLGAPTDLIQSDIERLANVGSGRIGQGMQLTGSAKQVINLAYDEAKQSNVEHIGTEHLLIGLIREEQGLAGQVLTQLGVTIDLTREAVRELSLTMDLSKHPPRSQDAKGRLIDRTQQKIGDMASATQATSDGPPWMRFTERSRKAVFFAQKEAERLGSTKVGPEHLLLGLISEEDNAACSILIGRHVQPKDVPASVDMVIQPGSEILGRDMQLTPEAKQVIDLSWQEARQLKNSYVGPEHLLLGLIRQSSGAAFQVLCDLGVTIDQIRGDVISLGAKEDIADSK
jgi:ATP-dependent Clp protease ATP-binding subunit ClpA